MGSAGLSAGVVLVPAPPVAGRSTCRPALAAGTIPFGIRPALDPEISILSPSMTQPASTSDASGVLSWRLRETPVVVFAVETTGFPAGRHRVCELALSRIEPGRSPELVFDSLIDPDRPMTGGEIHGLTDRDVADAPRFEEVAAEVVDRLSGAVLVAYNMAFTLPFLECELERAGVRAAPPHLSLMALRPALGLGGRCSLEVACAEAGVPCEPVACARADAQASAELFGSYAGHLERRGIETLRDLAGLGDLPFLASLVAPPLEPAEDALRQRGRRGPRRRVVRSLRPAGDLERLATRRYWDAVAAALSDFELSELELGLVRRMRELLELPEERMRAVHARAFLGALATFAGDDWLAEEEAEKLRSLMRSLALLGWSPGA
jgi:DNA polymerase-3 subunit epsilon